MRAAERIRPLPSSVIYRPEVAMFFMMVAVAAVMVMLSGVASAQAPKTPPGKEAPPETKPAKQRPSPTQRPTKRKSKEEDEKLKPRPVILKTKDGIEVRSFYFPSDKGKEAIPVLIVHEWRGQASPYLQLVLALREAGCAVLVPDYRGHGGSMVYVDRRGREQKFDVARMGKRDVGNIIAMDLEKAKGFLKEENDAGNLNLNALVIIGIREGCILGTTWAARDWSFPSIGAMKQGQDVKGIVMVSPDKQIKGVPIDPALKDPNILRLPILIIGGSTNPEAKETRRIAKRIEGVKTRVGGGTAPGFKLEMIDTSLTGPALVNEASEVIPTIVDFIKDEVRISDNENPWIQRN
ncbi:alpha/beta hydrolase [Rubripirellula obstinata]|nr:hydrolase [Rubripirellula obstinata]